MDRLKSQSALRIAVAYLVVVGLWFLDGSTILRRIFEEGGRLPRELTIAADLLVCVATAAILYTLLRRDLLQKQQTTDAVQRAEELEVLVRQRTAELAAINRSLEQRVQERTTELSTLLQISHEVGSTLDLQVLMETILDRLSLMVDFTGASIIVRRDDGLAYMAYKGPRPRQEVQGLFVPLSEAPILQEVLEHRQPLIVPDLLDDSPLAHSYRERTSERVKQTVGASRSLMAVPLLVKDRAIGVFRFEHCDPNHFTPHDADLATAIASEAAIAIENARLYEEARKIAGLEERQRLARELHDSVAQSIYGIALGAHAAQEMLARNSDETAATLSYVISLAQSANVEMRSLILELRPEYLEREGLRAALERQVAATRARYSLEVEAELCPEPAMPLDKKEALYRVAQQALNNTGRHAKASKVTLRLCTTPSEIELEITDNGIGFDTNLAFPGHMGLQSMPERVVRLGGAFHIVSSPGHGTQVHASLPL